MTDICAAWKSVGAYERIHDIMKVVANTAHANGMKFTLWVWAAEFSGHG